MAKKKKRAVKRKKKTATRRTGKSLFKIAASNKGFKAAKKRKAKADAASKRAWKKALAVAKKKLRKMR